MLLNHAHAFVLGAIFAAVDAQVTVKMVGLHEHTSYYCTKVRPSQCCKAISFGFLGGGCIPTFIFNTFVHVELYNLPPSSMAASFTPRFGIDENCNGRIKESKYLANGGDALLSRRNDWRREPSVSGGGYIRCGEPRPEGGWLTVIAGLCLPFLNHVVKVPRAWWAEDLDPSEDVPSSVYPDIITINGTNYTDGGLGNMMYRSDGGELLNLNPIGGTNPWTHETCTPIIEARIYCWTDNDCKEGMTCQDATSADLNVLLGAKVPQVRNCV